MIYISFPYKNYQHFFPSGIFNYLFLWHSIFQICRFPNFILSNVFIFYYLMLIHIYFKFYFNIFILYICKAMWLKSFLFQILGSLVTCFQCPSAFHARESCIPAGCVTLIPNISVLCPFHFVLKTQNNSKRAQVINVNNCIQCNEGNYKYTYYLIIC